MILFKLFLLIIIIYIINYINTFENLDYTSVEWRPTVKIHTKIDLDFFTQQVLGPKITLYKKNPDTKTTYSRDQNNLNVHTYNDGTKSIKFINEGQHSEPESGRLIFYVKDYNLKFNVNGQIYIVIPNKFKTCGKISYMSNDSSKSYELSECDDSNNDNILLLNNLDNFEKNMLIPQ
jgi:hypothetical protein